MAKADQALAVEAAGTLADRRAWQARLRRSRASPRVQPPALPAGQRSRRRFAVPGGAAAAPQQGLFQVTGKQRRGAAAAVQASTSAAPAVRGGAADALRLETAEVAVRRRCGAPATSRGRRWWHGPVRRAWRRLAEVHVSMASSAADRRRPTPAGRIQQ